MTESVPVAIAYLKGQLTACHEAIALIWHTFDDVNAGTRDSAELIDAIRSASDLLPEDMRNERKLVGRTYWYHPESGCHFTLEHGADHPASTGTADGAMCIQISEAKYKAETRPAGSQTVSDDFEDILG